MAELEGKLKQEKVQHAATRADAQTTAAALARKATALLGAEAEQKQMQESVRETEALLRELTHTKLEEGAQDAAARRAQHMHAVCHQRADPVHLWGRGSLILCVWLSVRPCQHVIGICESGVVQPAVVNQID